MKYFLLLLLLFFSSCETFHSTPQILPPHIKKIFIKPFINKTNVFGLEENLRLDTINEFLRDGRFQVVSSLEDSDGYSTGEILFYILQPTSYGTNYDPQQFKIRFIINLYFVDRVNNVTLWEEPNLEEVLFFSAPTLPGGLTEEEAKKRIVSNMAKKIYIRTIQGFGSVTGTSEKKVPKEDR